MARTQGKHSEFGLNWSMATLLDSSCGCIAPNTTSGFAKSWVNNFCKDQAEYCDPFTGCNKSSLVLRNATIAPFESAMFYVLQFDYASYFVRQLTLVPHCSR